MQPRIMRNLHLRNLAYTLSDSTVTRLSLKSTDNMEYSRRKKFYIDQQYIAGPSNQI